MIWWKIVQLVYLDLISKYSPAQRVIQLQNSAHISACHRENIPPLRIPPSTIIGQACEDLQVTLKIYAMCWTTEARTQFETFLLGLCDFVFLESKFLIKCRQAKNYGRCSAKLPLQNCHATLSYPFVELQPTITRISQKSQKELSLDRKHFLQQW